MKAVPAGAALVLAGVTVTVRLLALPPKSMPAVEIRAGFEEAPVKLKLAAGVSASPIRKLIGAVKTSSAVLWSGMLEMVGSALILNVKTREPMLLEDSPSFASTVIDAVPNLCRPGVTVSVRLAPLPPTARFASGTIV